MAIGGPHTAAWVKLMGHEIAAATQQHGRNRPAFQRHAGCCTYITASSLGLFGAKARTASLYLRQNLSEEMRKCL